MTIEISTLAYSEIEDARVYYNLQQENLGERFKEHIKQSVDSIAQFPMLYPKITDELHRVIVHKFPYSIFYALFDEKIVIVSVAHQHRKPFYEVK